MIYEPFKGVHVEVDSNGCIHISTYSDGLASPDSIITIPEYVARKFIDELSSEYAEYEGEKDE